VLLAGDNRHQLLGALVSDYNARIRGHAVVIESPLNYLYRDAVATIAQREVGTDVPDYRTAIQQAIRIGADLLVIGEIEDADTADAVLTAAEWGIPVTACVCAPDAEQACWWIERLFIGERRTDIARRLTAQIQAIVAVRSDGPLQVVDRTQPVREAV
jgi:Tfp pilus assembly ATPase PilU